MRSSAESDSVDTPEMACKPRKRCGRGGSKTQFICINTRACRACGRCVNECPEGALGMINFIIHKHVVVADGGRCTGCGRCVRLCEFKVICRVDIKEI